MVSRMKILTLFLWQIEWPQDIQYALISDTNSQGYITIDDLELEGIIPHWLALDSTHLPLKLEHIGTFSDNMSAVSWAQKMISSVSIVSGNLLCMLIFRIHEHKVSSVTPLRVAGKDNEMVDIAS